MIDSLAEIHNSHRKRKRTQPFSSTNTAQSIRIFLLEWKQMRRNKSTTFPFHHYEWHPCIQFESIWKFASNIFVTLNTVRFFQFNFFFFFFFFIHSATMYLSLFFFLQWFIVYPIYWNIMGYFIQFVEISSNHSCVLNTHKQIASRNILPVRWFNTLPKFISRKP